MSAARSGAATPEGSGSGRPSSDEEERIEQQEEPGTTGVHHAGLGQHGQHLGRPGQRVGRLAAGALHDAHQVRTRFAAPSAAAVATVRIVPSTGRTTARRASAEAWAIDSTSTSGPTPASPDAPMRSLMPRSSWDRMTPSSPGPP